MVSEFDLLLSCLQTRWCPDKRPLLASKLTQSWDWVCFIQFVAQHGMAPFLYDLVQQGYVSPLPTTVKAQLWAYQRLSAVQNQEMAVEVVRLVTGMAAVGVTAVPLKGVALAAAVYGGVNHRQTGDIDLWISPDDLEVCMNQLGEMGYVAKRPFTDAQEHVWRQINYEQTWGHPELKVIVDLHWQLMPPRLAIKFEPMTPLLIQPLADDSISIFAPEDHLLYLCLHGYKHSWYRLSWVVDLACLISTYPNLDWEAVIIQAKKHHIQRVIRLGLLLAHRLLKVQLPTIVHSWLEEDAKVDAILPTIIAQLAQINFKPNEQYSWAEHRYLMAGRERIRDKVWFTIYRSFTLSEHDLASYPFSTHSLFLYRMLRPFRFLSHFLIPRKNN